MVKNYILNLRFILLQKVKNEIIKNKDIKILL